MTNELDLSGPMAAVAELRRLAGAECVVEGGDLNPEGDLYAEEHAMVAQAVESRRQQFRAGRIYARRALDQLGVNPRAILANASRSPVWPEGIVGSITHTRQVCAVLAASTRNLIAIGADIDEDVQLGEKLAKFVATTHELRNRKILEEALGLDLAKLLFIIKEAVYKAYQPVTGTFLGFGDVDVDIDPDERRFRAAIVEPSVPPIHGARHIEGRFSAAGGFLIAYARVPRATPAPSP